MSTFDHILKFNPYHEAAGSSDGGRFTRGSGVDYHETRFNYAVETNKVSRHDLGHFADSKPRVIVDETTIGSDKVWQGAEDTLLSRVSPEEKAKLTEFTGAKLYAPLARDMAKGKTSNRELYDSARMIHSALQKSEIPEDITLFRGMTVRGVFEEGTKAIGKVFNSKTFQSTSLLQDNAIQFASSKEPACLIRIKAKKGQKGAYLDGKISQNPREQEVLLPSNSNFIIVGHSLMEVGMGKATQKISVYDVEYL